MTAGSKPNSKRRILADNQLLVHDGRFLRGSVAPGHGVPKGSPAACWWAKERFRFREMKPAFSWKAERGVRERDSRQAGRLGPRTSGYVPFALQPSTGAAKIGEST